MIVKVLLENGAVSDEFLTEHGLSLYLETESRKILFDTGMTNKFIMNAKTLDVDLRDIDMVVLSHGHYDHGGGLLDFLDMNQDASIYIQKEALIPHGANKEDKEIRNIGINKEIKQSDKVKIIDKDISFEDDLVLFSYIDGEILVPEGNNSLLMKKGEFWEKDDFKHEQNLIIKEGSNRILIVGCSHRGIVNILKQAEEISDLPITHVLGGFHLSGLDLNNSKDIEFLKSVGDRLLNSEAVFYTGHCTGQEQYYELKKIMGDRINKLSTGTTIII